MLEHKVTQIRPIQYEYVGLQGKIRAKSEGITALQRRYMSYLANEDKLIGITIAAKKKKLLGISVYLYAGNMAKDGVKLQCC